VKILVLSVSVMRTATTSPSATQPMPTAKLKTNLDADRNESATVRDGVASILRKQDELVAVSRKFAEHLDHSQTRRNPAGLLHLHHGHAGRRRRLRTSKRLETAVNEALSGLNGVATFFLATFLGCQPRARTGSPVADRHRRESDGGRPAVPPRPEKATGTSPRPRRRSSTRTSSRPA
jgi:hypothetical protein